jgi:hypothetical protein
MFRSHVIRIIEGCSLIQNSWIDLILCHTDDLPVFCVVRAAAIYTSPIAAKENFSEFRGSRVIEQEMARKLHSDFKY